jgi:diaminopimelate epimerase
VETLNFAKLQGTGNDFVVIDNRNNEFHEFIKPLNVKNAVKIICSRKTGVGADGLILVEKSEIPNTDFKWKFFNSDGSEAEMCGNGARCVSRFVVEKGICPERHKFETKAGIIESEVSGRTVKVKLTQPTDWNLNIKWEGLTLHFVNTGVPHVVVFVDRVQSVNVEEIGRKIRHSPLFAPQGTNVNFAEVRLDRVIVRTYERGVEGETLACGTGATASALIAAKLYNLKSPVEVEVKSGERLKIYFDREFKNIYLEGETTYVYDGKLKKELLEKQ